MEPSSMLSMSLVRARIHGRREKVDGLLEGGSMIRVWSQGRADDHMKEEILLRTGEAVHRHPWWTARARLTLALLARNRVHPPSRILDAGCGWGVTLAALETAGYEATGLDVSPRILDRLDAPDRRLIQGDLTQPWPGGTDRETFEAVLALDVIEHLDDDRGAVASLASLVDPGGLLVVSVPAQPSLFSEFDEVQGHRRRYPPAVFRSVFENSGLSVDTIFWWGAWMVPILRRRLGRREAGPGVDAAEVYLRNLRLPPWPGPLVLRAAYALEQPLALRGWLPTGTSLFAVARRPS